MSRGRPKTTPQHVSAASSTKTMKGRNAETFDFPVSVDPAYTPNSVTVLENRYLKKDTKGNLLETPKDMLKRVASNLATVDYNYGATEEEVVKTAQEFYTMMAKMEFNPNTPTLVNAGRPLQMLSACFVLPVGDSMDEIFDAIKATALIHKAGGGTGFAFSRLRPYGDFIASTTRSTSGPLAFLEVFNTATNVVKQGGVRRGANMGILNIHHPDILRFIVAKINEYLVVNFNLSVGATHAFFYKIDADKKFIGSEYDPAELIDKISALTLEVRDQEEVWRTLDKYIAELEDMVIATHEGEGYDIINPRTKQVVKKYNAAKIFDLATRIAWRCGDPGMINLDSINESTANPVPDMGPVESTNPCFTKDTWIQTSQGPRQISDLLGMPFMAKVNGQHFASGPQGFFATGHKPIVKIQTREGYTLRVTGNHQIRQVIKQSRNRSETTWTAAETLQKGDKIVLHDHRSGNRWEGKYTFDQGYLIGLLVGDGTLKADKAILSAWKQSKGSLSPLIVDGSAGIMAQAYQSSLTMPHRSDYAGWIAVSGRNEYRLSLAAIKQLAAELGMQPHQKSLTATAEKTSSEFHQGVLRGLFDADGSVQGTQHKGVSIRLAQSDQATLETVQRMLLRFGIVSRLYTDRRQAGYATFTDRIRGTYQSQTKAQHELVISGENILTFAKEIGFSDDRKRQRLATLLSVYKRALNREEYVATVASVTSDGEADVYDVQVPGIHSVDANGMYAHNCGEQPLYPYDSCNLGSINLGAVVTGHKLVGEQAEIDWAHLERNVKTAVHLLDNVIDANNYPIPQIANVSHNIRRIGLGVMGWADMLVKLGIPYDSEEALELGEKVMKFVNEKGHEASQDLAEKRGPFPMWDVSIYNQDSPYFKGKHEKLRNSTVTTIAPTGTISMIAGCSYGIEPFFGLAFTKQNILGGKQLFEVNPLFLEVAKKRGFYSEALMAKVSEAGGAIREIEEIPEDVRRVFVVSREIPVGMHVKMQAAFQRYTDNAVSKTINLPNEATVDDVKAAYRLAYTTGCKGITIYRDGSREKQVVEYNKKDKQKEEVVQLEPNGISEPAWTPHKLPTPNEAWGFRLKKKSDVGNIYTSVFRNEDGIPMELFINAGKNGGYVAGAAQVTGRLASLAMKYGASVEEVAEHLIGVSCGAQVGFGPNAVLSMFDAVGKSMLELVQNRQLSLIMDAIEENQPEAGEQMQLAGVATAASNGNGHTNGNGSTNGHSPMTAASAAPSQYSQAQLSIMNADPSAIPTIMAEKIAQGTATVAFEACPECQGRLFMAEGCMSCVNPGCGYSKCG